MLSSLPAVQLDLLTGLPGSHFAIYSPQWCDPSEHHLSMLFCCSNSSEAPVKQNKISKSLVKFKWLLSALAWTDPSEFPSLPCIAYLSLAQWLSVSWKSQTLSYFQNFAHSSSMHRTFLSPLSQSQFLLILQYLSENINKLRSFPGPPDSHLFLWHLAKFSYFLLQLCLYYLTPLHH